MEQTMRERAGADPHRPRFHFVPPFGWLNDPNGLCERDGRFHLFYQFNPAEPRHGNIHWGHASSADLVHWTDEPVALAPGPGGPDADGCWSGVLVDDDGVPTIVYSGHRDDVGQRTCLAFGSDDLRTWRKHDGNPVLADPPPGVDLTEYRDHCVWREDGEWRQLVGSGLTGRGGTALLYRSADLRTWEYLGPLVVGDAATREPVWTGTTWECVDLFRLGVGEREDADVLVFSVWDDELTLHPACLVGRYDGRRFAPARTQLLDYGLRHFYAPQSMRATDGRRLMFGWMQEARTAAADVAAGWSGVMSLPREVTLGGDGSVLLQPAAEVARLRRDRTALGSMRLFAGEEVTVLRDAGDQTDLEAAVVVPEGALVGLQLRRTPDAEEVTRLCLDGRAGGASVTLGLDRSASTLDRSVDTVSLSGPVPVGADRTVRLRVVVDHSAVEIFANGRPLSARIYPTRADATGIAVTVVHGEVQVEHLDVWRMADAWSGPRPPVLGPATR